MTVTYPDHLQRWRNYRLALISYSGIVILPRLMISIKQPLFSSALRKRISDIADTNTKYMFFLCIRQLFFRHAINV